MGSYVIQRLLLMVPTFFGILIITFVILRLNGITLTEQMNAANVGTMGGGAAGGSGMGGGERKIQGASRNIENYLDRFRRSGNDLPPLIDLRGFWTKDTVVAMLRASAADSARPASARSKIEKELWLAGHFAVAPLAEVLEDPALSALHPAASMAFSLCAYVTIDKPQMARLTSEQLALLEARNAVLHDNRFVADDPAADAKREALLAVFHRDEATWRHSAGAAWSAILTETGFVKIMTLLCTGQLWSESRQEYAFTIIGQRWYVTAGLNITSVILAWLVSIPLGIRSARRVGTLEDQVTTNTLFLLWSLPTFFVGTLLLHHLCTNGSGGYAIFPNHGLPGAETFWYSTPHFLLTLLWHSFLPLVALTYSSFTVYSRYMRGNLLDQLHAEYVRTARAKGCSEDAVVYRHAVRNSLLTLITLAAGLLSDLFGGFVVVEWIFSIPGLGSLTLDAARQFDAPLVMASTVITVGLLLVGILISDLLYGVADPRIRARYG
jgi:ABC-type dipeptide/oligopeptide/nickel transport system permease component